MLAKLGLVVGALGCGDASPAVSGDAGTGDGGSLEAGPECAPGSPPDARWTRVDFADHPALRTVGGAALIEVPADRLHVGILRASAECALVVWSVCPHGACFVGWDASAQQWVCPCHGSRFAADGALVNGPAERALRRFEAVVADDHVLVRGPLA
jgi:Rieske Fe-S protein